MDYDVDKHIPLYDNEDRVIADYIEFSENPLVLDEENKYYYCGISKIYEKN